MKKHTCTYVEGKSKKIAVCWCGKFRHINLKPEDIIVEMTCRVPWHRCKTDCLKDAHTLTPWERIALNYNHNLFDTRIKAEHALLIVNAVNSYEENEAKIWRYEQSIKTLLDNQEELKRNQAGLLSAARLLLAVMELQGDPTKDEYIFNLREFLEVKNAIKQVEGK